MKLRGAHRMPEFSAKQLETWSGGQWSEQPRVSMTSVGHDTRTLKPGALYVALAGARVDGHDLIPDAASKGAVAVLCRKGKAFPGTPCLEVEDPGMALRSIAHGHRKRLRGTIFGITGSAGKTTAKDFLKAMCAAAGPTCATPGNYNNFVGLPLSILRMEVSDRFGVFEMGMNHAGEIAALAEILEPEMGCITSIGEAHLEQLGSVTAIANEKTSLFHSLKPEGLAVIDCDSEWQDLMRSQAQCRTVGCSLYADADIVGHAVSGEPGRLRIEDRTRGEIWEIPVPLPGEHMRKNLLQTAILARAGGVLPEHMREGLLRYEGSPLRWQELSVGERTLINDAYNANPLSMRCAVRAFVETFEGRERWAILGEMAELGAEAESLHRMLGAWLDRQDLRGILAVGRAGGWIAAELKQVPVEVVDSVEAAAGAAEARIPRDAAVLLKASRSVKLETLIPLLHKEHTP